MKIPPLTRDVSIKPLAHCSQSRAQTPTSFLSFIPRPQNSTEPKRSSNLFFQLFPNDSFANSSVTALSWRPKFCSQGLESPSYPSAHPFSLCLMYLGKGCWHWVGLSKEVRTLNFRPFLWHSSCGKQIPGSQVLPSKTGEGMGQRWAFSRVIQATSRFQVLPSPKTTSRRTTWKF